MVADTSLHIMGWSNEKVLKYLQEPGSEYARASLLDRVTVIPAQLTSYDSGALEIDAIRTEYEKKMGDKFDIKEFHHRTLKNGFVALEQARRQVLGD